MAFTVTATQGGSTANGMCMVLEVLTGAGGIQPGTIGQANALNVSIDPAFNNSWIYGAVVATSAAPSTETGQTILQNQASGDRYWQMRSTAYQVAGTPFLFGLAAGGPLGVAAAEIIPSGTLLQDSSSPPVSGLVNSTSITTASFQPPTGSILVLMISAHTSAGVMTMSVSDTSTFNLGWTQQAAEVSSGNGYAGVWTAGPLPSTLTQVTYSMRMFP